MQTLQVTESNAITAFNNADSKGKQLLKNLFGEKVFVQKITDRVKTFEDACEVLGFTAGEWNAFPVHAASQMNVVKEDAISIFAYSKLSIIARALNEGWKPNWDDRDEYKYYPYFQMKAGFGFSFTNYDHWHSYSHVGSRLCYRTRELAEYAGKQFEAIYNEFLSL